MEGIIKGDLITLQGSKGCCRYFYDSSVLQLPIFQMYIAYCVCCLRIVVSNIYFVVSVLFVFVLCTLCCQFLWIVHLVLSNVYLDLFWLLKILLPQCPQIKLVNVNGIQYVSANEKQGQDAVVVDGTINLNEADVDRNTIHIYPICSTHFTHVQRQCLYLSITFNPPIDNFHFLSSNIPTTLA